MNSFVTVWNIDLDKIAHFVFADMCARCLHAIFLSFGYGPSCINEYDSQLVMLLQILKNYRIECPQKELKLIPSITYTPVEAVKMRFIQRSWLR